jgi:macrophage erythroblast attacher
MAEHSILKLDPDSHLLLERPLLRLPHELLKKTLKSAQRAIEPVNKQTTTAIQASTGQLGRDPTESPEPQAQTRSSTR